MESETGKKKKENKKEREPRTKKMVKEISKKGDK